MILKNMRINNGIYKKEYSLCKHITIIGEKKPESKDDCEYIHRIPIKCKVCNKTYIVEELIN